MPVEILAQLKALRQNVAEALQKDPRFLTLTSLDKSIAEITSVLISSGALPADSAVVAPAPIPGIAPQPAAPANAVAPASTPPAKRSVLKPALAGAAALAAGASLAVAGSGEAQAEEAPAAGSSDEGDDAQEDDPAEPSEEAAEPDESAPEEAPAGVDEAAAAVESEDEKTEPPAARASAAADEEDEAAVDENAPASGRASGYTPMAPRPGAVKYQPSASIRFAKLPPAVDLRQHMTPVEDQGQTSSCVANAVAGAYEYWVKKATRRDTNISRLFVYYNARWRDGSQDKDEGSVIQLAMEGLQKFGACSESVWPFEKKLVLHKPGSEAYEEASQHRVHDMAQVPLELEVWKQALAEGKPIVFGCALFSTFDDCSKRGGVVPMPSPTDVTRGAHGNHSMCAVGYNDHEKVFIVRNSWGADWGEGGYCYMPYDYLLNPKFNDSDSWVFTPRTPLPLPRDTWINEPTFVTNRGQGVDFDISPYRIADYASIVVDLFSNARRPFNATLLSDYSEYVSWSASSEWSMMESCDVETLLSEEEEFAESEFESEETSEESATSDLDEADANDTALDAKTTDDETADGETSLDEDDEAGDEAAADEQSAEDETSDSDEASDEMSDAEIAAAEEEAEAATLDDENAEAAFEDDAAEEEPEPEPEEEPEEDDSGDDGGDDSGGDDGGDDDSGGDDSGDDDEG